MISSILPFSDVQAVLFDLDGTLVDSAPDLGAAADKMRQVRGLSALPLDDYRPMAGSGARGMLHIALGVTPERADFLSLRDEFFANYHECLTQRTRTFAGVVELIDALLHRQIPWGVVTNKSSRFAIPLTTAMPMFASASAMICGDTTAYSKPHPEPLLEAARLMGVDPTQCVYIGDDKRDIDAGLAAGMTTVAVTYGYLGAVSDIDQWGAHAKINAIGELLQLISRS